MSSVASPVKNIGRITKQLVRGMPYVKKELERAASMKLGRPLTGPQIYYVIFSGRCNVSCTFCSIWKEVEPMLSGDVMKRIVRESRELSGRGYNISLSGGEPLIYKPLFETLELANELDVNFGFTTNGYLLTKSNVERALAANLFNINVSIESVDPAVNESVRPRKDGTRQTLSGIDNIVEEKRRTGARVSIMAKTTIMEQNYRALPELVRYFAKYPEVQNSFQPYVGLGNSSFWIKDRVEFAKVIEELKKLRAEGANIMANAETLDGFVRYFDNPPTKEEPGRLNLEGERRGCDVGYRTMLIKPDGAVQFCDLLTHSDVGNVHTSSLKDIFYNEVAKKLRRRIDYCNVDCQRTCQRPISLASKARSFLKMG